MYVAFTFQCYYVFELDIYRNSTLLNASSPILPGVIDLNPNLQVLCASQIQSPVTVTIFDRQYTIIAQYKVFFQLFPMQIQLQPLISKNKTLNQNLLSRAASVSFSVSQQVLYSTELDRVRILEDLSVQLTSSNSNLSLILGICIPSVFVFTFIIAYTIYYMRKRKNPPPILKLYDPEVIKARFALATQSLNDKNRKSREKSYSNSQNNNILTNNNIRPENKHLNPKMNHKTIIQLKIAPQENEIEPLQRNLFAKTAAPIISSSLRPRPGTVQLPLVVKSCLGKTEEV
ncbi:Hypothetical_protein [Hexamita inflata]|uniref:Hypothetical_protein n=1 Tax=Hexamita inflata TaxID=28002 RepID=A0AA86UYS2_9EUKA|nr:Hypothetical protein HINF_LOCUS65040 [Hexamita inflata]